MLVPVTLPWKFPRLEGPKMMGLGKGNGTLEKLQFLVSMLDFWGVYSLGGGFNHVWYSSLLGEDSQFDEHIFQLGWFNHQPV